MILGLPSTVPGVHGRPHTSPARGASRSNVPSERRCRTRSACALLGVHRACLEQAQRMRQHPAPRRSILVACHVAYIWARLRAVIRAVRAAACLQCKLRAALKLQSGLSMVRLTLQTGRLCTTVSRGHCHRTWSSRCARSKPKFESSPGPVDTPAPPSATMRPSLRIRYGHSSCAPHHSQLDPHDDEYAPRLLSRCMAQPFVTATRDLAMRAAAHRHRCSEAFVAGGGPQRGRHLRRLRPPLCAASRRTHPDAAQGNWCRTASDARTQPARHP